MREFLDKIKQYRQRVIVRIIKSTLRKIGFTFEKFLVLERELNGTIVPKEPKIKVFVRELQLQDLERSAKSFNLSNDKLELLKKRLLLGTYIALGAFDGDRLVYSCWLSLNVFESSINLSGRLSLEEDEGLLLDAFTHPDYRGLGIHTYMNAVRLNKLMDVGKKKAIVMVLSENVPAIKSQISVGFQPKMVISYVSLFGKEFIKFKGVDLGKFH